MPILTKELDTAEEVIGEIRTRSLFTMRLDARPSRIIGSTPSTFRQVRVIDGGRFEGDRLSERFWMEVTIGRPFVPTAARCWTLV